jgi:hypothetical protein
MSQQYGNNPYLPAVRGSAAQDLKCPQEQISIQTLSTSDSQFAADGCGQRAVYSCPGAGSAPCQMLLVSKIAK